MHAHGRLPHFAGFCAANQPASNFDLLVGVSPSRAGHDRRRLRSGLEFLHLAHDLVLRLAGEGFDLADAHAVGAVAIGAGGGEVAAEIGVAALRCSVGCAQGGDRCRHDEGNGAHDALLVSVARRLHAAVRPVDFAAGRRGKAPTARGSRTIRSRRASRERCTVRSACQVHWIKGAAVRTDRKLLHSQNGRMRSPRAAPGRGSAIGGPGVALFRAVPTGPRGPSASMTA